MLLVAFLPEDETPPAEGCFDHPKQAADFAREVLAGRMAVYAIGEDEVDASDAWGHLLFLTGGDVAAPVAALRPGQHLELATEDGRLWIGRTGDAVGTGRPVPWRHELPC